jgi:hypothetical protein
MVDHPGTAGKSWLDLLEGWAEGESFQEFEVKRTADEVLYIFRFEGEDGAAFEFTFVTGPSDGSFLKRLEFPTDTISIDYMEVDSYLVPECVEKSWDHVQSRSTIRTVFSNWTFREDEYAGDRFTLGALGLPSGSTIVDSTGPGNVPAVTTIQGGAGLSGRTMFFLGFFFAFGLLLILLTMLILRARHRAIVKRQASHSRPAGTTDLPPLTDR